MSSNVLEFLPAQPKRAASLDVLPVPLDQDMQESLDAATKLAQTVKQSITTLRNKKKNRGNNN